MTGPKHRIYRNRSLEYGLSVSLAKRDCAGTEAIGVDLRPEAKGLKALPSQGSGEDSRVARRCTLSTGFAAARP
jgi:hypothetical protein